MNKVIRLTESDLVRIVKRVVNEQLDNSKWSDCLNSTRFKNKKNSQGVVYKQYDGDSQTGMFGETPRMDLDGLIFYQDGKVYDPRTKKTSRYVCRNNEVEIIK